MHDFPMRINKYIAHQGIATRTGADELVVSGKVFINGTRAVLGTKVNENDIVDVRSIQNAQYDYIIYYKPRGIITHSPASHEVDIATRIKKDHKITGVAPIGRLDKDSEGLILLSNDGRITERLLSPNSAHEKEYEVVVDKRVTGSFLVRMAKGVSIEGYKTKPAKTLANEKNECAFSIIITEGKKHQIRRMCAALGYQIIALKRVRIMNLTLRKLQPGQFHRLNEREAIHLRKSLGLV